MLILSEPKELFLLLRENLFKPIINQNFMLMKKLLLSFVCVLAFTALSAQVSENFSDYTVGGKLAQQAQAMGRDYWSTWSGAVGGPEDGVIGEMDGNKVYAPTFNVDQVLKLGNKTTGKWALYLNIYIPTGKDGYFNIMNNFPIGTTNNDWSCQFCFACNVDGTGGYAGVLRIYAGQEDAIMVDFTHDVWLNVKIEIDLDADQAKAYLNDNLVHSWQYTLGSFGSGVVKNSIDALDVYPSTNSTQSVFYIDNIVFQDASLPAPAPIMDVTPLTVSEKATEGDTEPFTTEISVVNTGEYAFGTYTSKVTYGGDVEDWITLTGDANGTVAPEGTNTFNIVMDPTDLEKGTYNANITVETNDVEHPSFTIACTLTMGGVGVDSYTLIQTKLFPNPTSGEVTIDCDKVINQIDILNYMGQVVYSSEVNTTTIKTDISQLSAGTYFVRIKTEVGTQTNKLIVK